MFQSDTSKTMAFMLFCAITVFADHPNERKSDCEPWPGCLSGFEFTGEQDASGNSETSYSYSYSFDDGDAGYSCPCEDNGEEFCNYQPFDGDTGSCESCPPDNVDQCYSDGLPVAGADDCAQKCFEDMSCMNDDDCKGEQLVCVCVVPRRKLLFGAICDGKCASGLPGGGGPLPPGGGGPRPPGGGGGPRGGITL